MYRERLAREPAGPAHAVDAGEVTNIAHLRSLPSMVSGAGGRGVTTVNVWQSCAQARDRWGIDAEHAIWGASTVKLILGGLSDAHDLANLVGTRDERIDTANWNGDGSASMSLSWREMPITWPEQIVTMPRGVALMIHPDQPRALVDLIPHTQRPYVGQLTFERDAVTAHLAHLDCRH